MELFKRKYSRSYIEESPVKIIDEVLQGLKLFDIVIPCNEEELGKKIGECIGKMQANLAKIKINELVDLPIMK